MMSVLQTMGRVQRGDVVGKVQHPDSLVDEALRQSCGAGLGAFSLKAGGVGGVTSNADGSAGVEAEGHFCECGHRGH